jgi:hypothetical protein
MAAAGGESPAGSGGGLLGFWRRLEKAAALRFDSIGVRFQERNEIDRGKMVFSLRGSHMSDGCNC